MRSVFGSLPYRTSSYCNVVMRQRKKQPEIVGRKFRWNLLQFATMGELIDCSIDRVDRVGGSWL